MENAAVRVVVPLLIVFCAGTLRAEDLVDFKLADTALVLKVPKEWKFNEGINSFGITFYQNDEYTTSLTGGTISHSSMAQLVEAAKAEKDVEVREQTTDSGLKGFVINRYRALPEKPNAPKAETNKPFKILQKTGLFKLNEVDAALISYERLETEDENRILIPVLKVMASLSANPEFTPPLPGGEYKSTRGKFSITPPAFLAMLPMNGGYRSGVEPGVPAARGLRIERVAETRSLNEVTHARIQFLRKEAPRASIPLITPFKTEQGLEGQRFETNTQIDEKEKIYHVQYFFLKNGELLTLSCNYYTRNETESRAAFDASARSLKME
jgi:hypothetical protein